VGCPKGNYNKGIMAGHPMLSFILLHLGAADCQPMVVPWIQHWMGRANLAPLTPEEWYDWGHGYSGGKYSGRGLWMPHETDEEWLLWTPPPMATSAAIKELLT
jgi:hypothetical protein